MWHARLRIGHVTLVKITVCGLVRLCGLPWPELQQIVDKTFIEADKDRDGLISFDEFQNVVEESDFGDKLTLRF